MGAGRPQEGMFVPRVNCVMAENENESEQGRTQGLALLCCFCEFVAADRGVQCPVMLGALDVWTHGTLR